MKYGLIGEKLGHSFSKYIHERLADYSYDLIPLTQDEFHLFMQTKDFDAINVTIPYKKAVLPYLDEIDEASSRIGAVNTIIHKNGKLFGYNTDYYGFDYMLKKHQVHLVHKKVLVLGNGGASAAIQAVIQSYPIDTMVIVNRTPSEHVISYEECYQRHCDAHIIINTTPVGMYPNNEHSPLQLDKFENLECVIDLIYNPLYTKFCLDAKKRQLQYIGGLEMLIAQAKYAVEYFQQRQINESIIDEIYRDMLKERVNIVLIGMPSCGKSTIALELSKVLEHRVIDLDQQIVEHTQLSIPTIFKQYGEETFRNYESQICQQYAIQNGMIISTGGGIIKKDINMEFLQQNGIIIFIDRDFEHLIYNDGTRPLSNSKENVLKLYQERLPLYQQYADIIVSNNDTIDNVIKNILKEYNHLLMNM